MKIAVVGIGHVGLANAIMLSQYHDVVALDMDYEKIHKINNSLSKLIDNSLRTIINSPLKLQATLDKIEAYNHAEFIIIATPTNYDPEKNQFNTESIESVIDDIITLNPKATVIIRSTVPIGYTKSLRQSLGFENIIFSPEFLREGTELHDCLFPSRIIVGDHSQKAHSFVELLLKCSIKKDIPVQMTGSSEAEAIKLFANAYLAMRVAYFNELDTYAETQKLNAKEIIKGVCLDSRIGDYYNNPSFGYGGYCLPKDTKQLLASFSDIPQNLIKAIVEANDTRLQFLVNEIVQLKPKVVGIYRLIAKSQGENFRESRMVEIIKQLKYEKIQLCIYEPLLKNIEEYQGVPIVKTLTEFTDKSDVILANRFASELDNVMYKTYTRDLFQKD